MDEQENKETKNSFEHKNSTEYGKILGDKNNWVYYSTSLEIIVTPSNGYKRTGHTDDGARIPNVSKGEIYGDVHFTPFDSESSSGMRAWHKQGTEAATITELIVSMDDFVDLTDTKKANGAINIPDVFTMHTSFRMARALKKVAGFDISYYKKKKDILTATRDKYKAGEIDADSYQKEVSRQLDDTHVQCAANYETIRENIQRLIDNGMVESAKKRIKDR